jgi:PKD repeat protein
MKKNCLSSLLLFILPLFYSELISQVKFSENKGQWESKILFRARLDAGNLFVEENCLTFNLYQAEKMKERHHASGNLKAAVDQNVNGHAYRISFVNCNSSSEISKSEAGIDYENYFIGNERSKWKAGVKNYQRILYRELYDGIDYELIGTYTGLKYNFIVKKGADPSLIKLKYEGVDKIAADGSGITYSLSVDKVIEQSPVVYQNINGLIKKVECRYQISGNTIAYTFPNGYDKNYELIIDPVLVFAAQSGSNADNFGMTATWDGQGNFYSGGTCFDIGYPTTVGAYSSVFSGSVSTGNTDVVISKYNSSGTNLIYSTYFGGSYTEIVTSMIVDNSDDLCFYGATSSWNFPTTAGAYDVGFNGGQPINFLYNGTDFVNGSDIYLAKFNSTGTLLMGSTFIGGSGNDGINHVNGLTFVFQYNSFEYQCDSIQHNYGDQYRGEIRVDRANNIYIASSSRSTDFPTVNAIDNTLGGQQDAVVAKFNPALTQLLFSTYLGGSSNDCGNSLIVTDQQEVFVTGGTCSPDFSTTIGAYSGLYSGGAADAYLAKISTLTPSLMSATFLGTGNYDQSYFVQSDVQNNIYIYGQSNGNMPVFGVGYSNAGTHQFISKFNNNLSTLLFNTTIGSDLSAADISPSAFSVDHCGNIYLSGWGGAFIPPVTSTLGGMPLLAATQSTTDGNDFYLMQLSPNAGSLLYGSYFGGYLSDEHVDGGTSRIDKSGVFYQSVCAGCGGNDDFPVTNGSWPNTPGNPNHSFNCNNGVFKINAQSTSMTSSNISANLTSGCIPLTVNLFNNSVNYSTFLWYLSPGLTNSVTLNPTMTFTAVGIYTVSLVVNNPSSCNLKDSSAILINVSGGPNPLVYIVGSTPTVCPGQVATFTAMGAATYSWSTGNFTSIISVTPAITTTYTVIGTDLYGCTGSAAVTLSVEICTGINEMNFSGKTKVYPNPASTLLNIVGDELHYHFKLYNLLGEIFVEKELSGNVQFGLEQLRSGIYFYEISYSEGRSSRRDKLIIDR